MCRDEGDYPQGININQPSQYLLIQLYLHNLLLIYPSPHNQQTASNVGEVQVRVRGI